MAKRIVKLCRDPYAVDLEEGGGWYMVDPRTGDVLYGSAVFHADRGLSFSLTSGTTGHDLRLQSPSSTFEIGWTDDAADAASWVDAVNRFLETKRGAAETNGKATSVPAERAVG
jgi:hypothetical protein